MSILFKKILIIAHLLLIFWLISVNTFYLHSHTLPDGTTFVHAHPYNKSKERNKPNEKHEHRFFEYLALDNTMHFILQDFNFECINYDNVTQNIFFNKDYNVLIAQTSDFKNRAPPLLLL